MDVFTTQFEWLKGHKDLLDQAIAETAERTLVDLRERSTNFPFDLSETARELRNLANGSDFCYDRPTCGLAYGLWYQGRRVNALLPVSLAMIRRFAGERLCVHDLGAGTGAVQWAIALAWLAARHTGMTAPASIRFVNVDSSPFMLRSLEHGWGALGRAFGDLRADTLSCEQHLNDWDGLPAASEVSCLFASYLFDSHEDPENLKRRFVHVVTKARADTVVLSTSQQKQKKPFLTAIEQALTSQRGPSYQSDWRLALSAPPLAGHLPCVNLIRKGLGLTGDAVWDETSLALSVLRVSATKGADAHSRQLEGLEGEALSLCNPRNVARTDLKLSRDQLTAAVPDGYPTVIYGPAGCGKSVVITERVRRLVEARANDPDLRILVTTFNKSLPKDVLVPWLKDLLGQGLVRWQSDESSSQEPVWKACWQASAAPFLYVMHFDILPTRLGLVHKLELPGTQVIRDEQLRALVEAVIAEAPELLKARRFNELPYQRRDFERFLRTDYLVEEYQRVFYGLGLVNQKMFLEEGRPGRPRVDRLGRPRAALWELISEIDRRAGGMDRPLIPRASFLARRKRFLKVLHHGDRIYRDWIASHPEKPLQAQLSGKVPFKTATGQAPWAHHRFFSHVFVDEVQDCNQADFGIFYKLLSDPNELVVAGDLAQAVHMGRSATMSFPRSQFEQRRRRAHELKGSYRLPLRISEAVIPLAERIRAKRKQCEDELELSAHHPYRGAPPGARPIVLWGRTTADMAQKVIEVLSIYRGDSRQAGFDVRPAVILEEDSDLALAINGAGRLGFVAPADSILSVKGLEKACVVWSTRAEVLNEQDVDEFVYTILTRTRSLLLISLFPDTRLEFRPILKAFNRESLIFWDEDSRQQFELMCEVTAPQPEGQDELEPNPKGDDITEQDPGEAV